MVVKVAKDSVTGQRIKLHRRMLNMTQESFAEACDVNRATVSCWERDAYIPDGTTLQRVASVLSVSTDYLLGRTNDSGSTNPQILPAVRGISSEKGTVFRPLYSTVDMYLVPVIPREFLVMYDNEFALESAAVEYLAWPQDQILAIANKQLTRSPYAIYVEDTDYLMSYNIRSGDKIVVAPCNKQEQGALALVLYYGFPTFRLVYDLPGEGILIQNDAIEILLTPEIQKASNYKYLGLVAGTVCRRPSPRSLMRRRGQ